MSLGCTSWLGCASGLSEGEGTGLHFSLLVFESRTSKLHGAVLEVCAQDLRDNGLGGTVDRLLPTLGLKKTFQNLIWVVLQQTKPANHTPGLEEILRTGRALDHCCAQGWSLLPAKECQRGSGWIREDQSGS